MQISLMNQSRLQNVNPLKIVILILSIVIFTGIVYQYVPYVDNHPNSAFFIGQDWKYTIQPSIMALLHGENPHSYELQNFVWVALPLLPLALLPAHWGAAGLFVLTVILFALTAYKLGMKPLVILLFLASPFVVFAAATGNVDGLTAIGLILPHPIGLFFLVLKPQISFGVILFWLWQAWQEGKWRRVAQVFGPVAIAILLEQILYDFWFIRSATSHIGTDPANVSLLPYGMFIGMALLVNAFQKKNLKQAIVSSPFLAPYLSLGSYSVALLGLNGWQIVLSSAGYYLYFILALWLR